MKQNSIQVPIEILLHGLREIVLTPHGPLRVSLLRRLEQNLAHLSQADREEIIFRIESDPTNLP